MAALRSGARGVAHVDEYRLLVRRARWFLEEAREALGRGRYDLACFLAEQAAQLRVKAALYKLVGDYPRLHQLRVLLGELARLAGGECRRRVEEFARAHRAGLSELEDAYLLARYGTKVYGREDAEDMVSLAERVVALVEEVEGACAGGS